MKNKNFVYMTLGENFYLFYKLSIKIFGVVFFYQLFDDNIFLALLPLALLQLLQTFIVEPLAKVSGVIGTQKALTISVIILVLSAFPIYFYQMNNNLILVLIWMILFGIGEVLFNTPRIFVYSQSSTHDKRGSEFAFKNITLTVTKILTPIVSGYIIATHGFEKMILLAALLMSFAILPVGLMKDYYYDFNLKSMKKWLQRKSTKELLHLNFLSQLGSSGGMLLWIIFLFLFLNKSFDNLGALITFTSAISLVVLYIFGKFLDDHNRSKSIKPIYIFYSLTFLLRGMFFIPPTINDIIYRIINTMRIETSEVINYDLMTDKVSKANQDEIVVIRELGMYLGGSISVFLCAILGYFLGIAWAFVILSILMLIMTLLFKEEA